jgi:hypothetical protein
MQKVTSTLVALTVTFVGSEVGPRVEVHPMEERVDIPVVVHLANVVARLALLSFVNIFSKVEERGGQLVAMRKSGRGGHDCGLVLGM